MVNQSDVQQWKEMARQSQEYKEKYGRDPLWIESAFSGMPAYTIEISGKGFSDHTLGWLAHSPCSWVFRSRPAFSF